MLDWTLQEHTRKVKQTFPKFRFDQKDAMDYLLKHHFKVLQKKIYEELQEEFSVPAKHQATFQICLQTPRTIGKKK